jgi:hypothetical protein
MAFRLASLASLGWQKHAMRFCAGLLTLRDGIHCRQTVLKLLSQKLKVSNSDQLFFPDRAIINGGDEHFFSLFQVL